MSDIDLNMIEDLDELDKQLLGSTTKNKDKETSKKKVKFGDIDEDDPLGDLLPDEDDSPKHASFSTTRDGKLADIFGIRTPSSTKIEDKTSAFQYSTKVGGHKPEIVTKNGDSGTKTSTLSNSETSRKNVKNVTINNYESSNASSVNQAQSAIIKDKKSSLLDDLIKSRTDSVTNVNAMKSSVADETKVVSSSFNTTNTNKSELVKSINTGYSPTISREGRRGRRNSTMLEDPLGLFNKPDKQVNESQKMNKISLVEKDMFLLSPTKERSMYASTEDLPEWLGGDRTSSKTERANNEKALSMPDLRSGGHLEIASNRTTSTQGYESTEQMSSTGEVKLKNPENVPITGTQFDQQAIIMSMQHDLKTATVLSQQYEQLGNTLEKQRLKLMEQEKQFSILVQKQMEGQVLLETQMKIQQDRIDNYVKTLIAQSSSIPTMALSANKNYTKIHDGDAKTDSDTLVKKLQLEKLELESALESIREKHEKEIAILDESYKKQISYLENSLEKLESRMRQDAESMETNFEIKIQQMKDKIYEIEKACEEDKDILKKKHEKFLEEVYDRHSRSIALLQKEYAETIDNITAAKKMETKAIEFMTAHGTDIDETLENSKQLLNGLQNLCEKVEEQKNTLIETRESYLQKQENNLKFLQETIEKEKNALDSDRQRIVEVIHKLEADSTRLISEFQNRMSQLIELEDGYKAREKALVRDRELLTEQLKYERECLQMAKEVWQKEQEREIEMLSKEREIIAAEKGKLDVFSKLKVGSDDIEKAELEASIKAAKEATMKIAQEQRKWQEKRRELEIQQNILEEKESSLIQRAKELEDLTHSALAKRDEGIKALREAHRIEQLYKDKFNQLQVQFEVLEERENRIAVEKLALARDRLSLRIGEVEKPEKDIDTVKVFNDYTDKSLIDVSMKAPMKTYFKDIVDPQLILLKMDLDNKLENTSTLDDLIKRNQ